MNFIKKLFKKNAKKYSYNMEQIEFIGKKIQTLNERIRQTIHLYELNKLNEDELMELNEHKKLIDTVKEILFVAKKLNNDRETEKAYSIIDFLENSKSSDILIELQENKIINIENLSGYERQVERILTKGAKTLRENNLEINETGITKNFERDFTVFELDREALLDELRN